jgi:hypothetical protein
MSGSTYALDGSASELKQHVNEQVEITGRLDSSASSTGSSSTGGTATSGAGTAAASSAQRLHVDSVKTVASSCSR